MITGKLDLAGGRWVPFVATLRMLGVDLTSATFALQLRLYPDAPGVPLVDLGTVATASEQGVRVAYAGTATVAAHIAAGRLAEAPSDMATADTLAMSLIGLRINETTMEGLPFPSERGDDNPLAWDLHVTPSGDIKQRWLAGIFKILAGATQ